MDTQLSTDRLRIAYKITTPIVRNTWVPEPRRRLQFGGVVQQSVAPVNTAIVRDYYCMHP